MPAPPLVPDAVVHARLCAAAPDAAADPAGGCVTGARWPQGFKDEESWQLAVLAEQIDALGVPEPPTEAELLGLAPDPNSDRPEGAEDDLAVDLLVTLAAAERSAAAPELLPAGLWLRDGSRAGTGATPGFAGGGVLDVLPPGAVLAGFAADAWAGGLAKPSDDELIGVVRAWRRLSSWAAAGELAAVAELSARRERDPQADPASLGYQAADCVADELACALTLTRRSAQSLADRASWLADLPATAVALRLGQIDMPKALTIIDGVAGLKPCLAHAVEDRVLAKARRQTTGELRAAVQRAVLAADPAAATRRREKAEKHARVELWDEPAGTKALAGRDLPPAEVLAADKRISAIARELKNRGADASLDLLRAKVYLALLAGQPLEHLLAALVLPPLANAGEQASPPTGNGQDVRPHGADADPRPDDSGRADCGARARRDTRANDSVQPGRDAWPRRDAGADASSDAHANRRTRPHHDARTDDSTETCAGRSADAPAQVGASVRAAARPDRYAEPDSNVGVTAPAVAGRTAAGDRASPPVPAGPCRGQPPTDAITSLGSAPGLAGGSPMDAFGRLGCLTGSVNLTVPLTTLLDLAESPGDVSGFGPVDAQTARLLADAAAGHPRTQWCLTVTDIYGRVIGHGCGDRQRARPSPAVAAHYAEPAQRAVGDLANLVIKLDRLAFSDCAHERETAGYQLSSRLRHLIEVRDRTCMFPGCRRPATRCDKDHTIPYDRGGRTCECNIAPLCRTHHQVKQALGWRLEQPEPGVLKWTTPAGRKYTVNRT
jgi:hypothetical protein